MKRDVAVEPVERPILCSPYAEPDQHWLYTRGRPRPDRVHYRREASYWFKTARAGSARNLLIADEDRDDLPLVNALRTDVRRWRKSGWRNASQTTKRLLRHWWRKDKPRRLFFCQLEAVETVLYLQEILAARKRIGFKPRLKPEEYDALCRGENPRPEDWVARVAQHPKLVDARHDSGLAPIPRYACKMATGSGKTVVMAMLIAWAFCNRAATPGDPRYPRRVLVLCPNLTIRDRLEVLRPDAPDNYYEAFDLVPSAMRPDLSKGKVLVSNWHFLRPQAPDLRVGPVEVGNLGEETPEAFARARLGELWDDEPLLVLNDEGHHAWRPRAKSAPSSGTEKARGEEETATVWVQGMDGIHAACGIALAVDLSATPFYIAGSGYPEGSPFPWIVSDFSLVDAIESGITKIPRLPARDDSGRPDPKYFRLWRRVRESLGSGDWLPGKKPKPEAVYREAEDGVLTLAGEWKNRFIQIQASAPGQDRTPPVMIVVCDNTDLAKHLHQKISGEGLVRERVEGKKTRRPVKTYGAGLPGFEEFWNKPDTEVTLRIDSKLLEQAESGSAKGGRKAEALRQAVSTVGQPGAPGEHIRCVVSVQMLSEGWDANNVTHILGLRAFDSQLLCEQVVGRGLRRMDYVPDPDTGLLTEEYVDVFGVPFSLIPFKGRQTGKSQPNDRPAHVVMALPERSGLEIRFPIVEGYVATPNHGRVQCDVGSVERTQLDPTKTPTRTIVRPESGQKEGSSQGEFLGFIYGGTELNRAAYHESEHMQTTVFRIAADVTRDLAEGERARMSRHSLFPQVLRIVQRYIGERVDRNGVDLRDLGLATYRQQVCGLLTDAITPLDSSGEPAELPRLNRYRPIGSTAKVSFKTIKPVVATEASHINFVACDTTLWEQMAAWELEWLTCRGVIRCYARNERLEFVIPYAFYGNDRAYEPDFIVQIREDYHLIVEIKGMERPETAAKLEAAKRWVRAVNRWDELGQWGFLVCRDPRILGDQILKHVAENGVGHSGGGPPTHDLFSLLRRDREAGGIAPTAHVSEVRQTDPHT